MDTNKFLLNKQLQAEKLKNLGQGQVPVSPDTEIPMTPAPLEDITPEQAAELDKLARLEALSRVGRGPASVSPSVQDMTEKSDMIAAPMDQYAPAGSFEGGKLGQQVSPDVTGTQSAPEVERLARLKALIQAGK